MTKILITGGAGFVGHHLIAHLLDTTDWDLVSLDRFDPAGNPARLQEILDERPESRHRVRSVFWDLKAEISEVARQWLGGPFDYIAHLAAASAVGRSISQPLAFFADNTLGTVNLLEYARQGGLADSPASRFLFFSTDESFGPCPLGTPGFSEWARMNPSNPYSASKASAEMACIAYANTYGLPITITSTMNIFGERQHPEKFIPRILQCYRDGEKAQIYWDSETGNYGSRQYLYAGNAAAAVKWVLEHGKTLDGSAAQGRYNIVGGEEINNFRLFMQIYGLVDGHRRKGFGCLQISCAVARPGYDQRYCLDGSLLESAGYRHPFSFEKSLVRTVRWTLDNPRWLVG